MESFKHKNKEVVFWRVKGEVLSQNKYSETHISTSGGGGYVGQHGGYVSAPQVHSKSVTNQEFWIRSEDGKEESVQLAGYDIPLREGQQVTLIYAGIKGEKSGYCVVILNHNAKKHWFIINAVLLNKHLNIDVLSGKSLLIAGGLWWLISQITDSVETGAVIAGSFAIIRLVTKTFRILKMTKTLERHLQSLVQAAYQNT